MQKKTRTEAGIIGQVSANDNTATHHIKPPPKKHRARCYMMRTGIEGWTENDILKYARLSSGRNYATELERLLNIRLERIDERNPDNIGSHFRYRLASRHDVLLVIQLVNYNALYNGHQQLTKNEINDILYLYPDTPAAA
ncbi:hypothetical protein GBL97_08960 [Yersinia pseudotuberculosis]|uniref:hypothetical protein n=1 Tax=Yersinia pseudotuberculosis TaxID=633 RepID=UPI001A9E90CA|nr:hypothetical protein [Yersinia pseudotuberculosis]MBO1565708.1 hypothetical protein [Yersinia pseudotuberculosis]MBO1602670.1 hypothetical protein [Yersinia pseudotuberculosis]